MGKRYALLITNADQEGKLEATDSIEEFKEVLLSNLGERAFVKLVQDADDERTLREVSETRKTAVDSLRRDAKIINSYVEEYGEMSPEDAEDFLSTLSQMILRGGVKFSGIYKGTLMRAIILMALTSARRSLGHYSISYDGYRQELKAFTERYYGPIFGSGGNAGITDGTMDAGSGDEQGHGTEVVLTKDR